MKYYTIKLRLCVAKNIYAICNGAHLRFSPVSEKNSDGWQIGLRYRFAYCFARFSHQQMTNMFFSGICDAENVV